MKCIILAAGYATRLYPLTENFPKPLLSVGGRPILDWLTDDISSSGEVDEYIVVSNHKFISHFTSWAEKSPLNITVIDDGTTANENRLGAVRDIELALKTLPADSDALIIAGDNVLSFSLKSFINYALNKKASCVMRYYEKDAERLKKCGVILTDGDDRVIDMTEKPAQPKSNWCCPPFYYYTAQDLSRCGECIRSGIGADAPGSFAAWTAQNSALYAMEMPGMRYDIGNLEGYKKIDKIYKDIAKNIV